MTCFLEARRKPNGGEAQSATPKAVESCSGLQMPSATPAAGSLCPADLDTDTDRGLAPLKRSHRPSAHCLAYVAQKIRCSKYATRIQLRREVRRPRGLICDAQLGLLAGHVW